MIYGYARVSKIDQELDRQLLELKKYNCDHIFTDKMSGSKFSRDGLEELLAVVGSGDTIIVTQIDRLGRSLFQLLELMEKWEKNNINFVAINQGLDTRTSTGKLVFSILGAVAEFERNLIIERTNQGLAVAKNKGITLGRKPKLNDIEINAAIHLRQSGKTIKEICETFSITKGTYYNQIRPKETIVK